MFYAFRIYTTVSKNRSLIGCGGVLSCPPSWERAVMACSPLQEEAGAAASAVVEESILESVEEKEEENQEPRLDDRRLLVSDDLGAILEHVESRWAELCSQLREGLGSRHNLFLAECGYCPEDARSECEPSSFITAAICRLQHIRIKLYHEVNTSSCSL
ncbi:uncharacterized protein LOC144159875 [Haemaphysalis longicornis]